jgi:hypothetical protein
LPPEASAVIDPRNVHSCAWVLWQAVENRASSLQQTFFWDLNKDVSTEWLEFGRMLRTPVGGVLLIHSTRILKFDIETRPEDFEYF